MVAEEENYIVFFFFLLLCYFFCSIVFYITRLTGLFPPTNHLSIRLFGTVLAGEKASSAKKKAYPISLLSAHPIQSNLSTLFSLLIEVHPSFMLREKRAYQIKTLLVSLHIFENSVISGRIGTTAITRKRGISITKLEQGPATEIEQIGPKGDNCVNNCRSHRTYFNYNQITGLRANLYKLVRKRYCIELFGRFCILHRYSKQLIKA